MQLNFFKKPEKVMVTAVNIKFMGAMHSINGFEVKGKVFTLTLPFQNKPTRTMINQIFKAEKNPPLKIRGIGVKQPFRFVSVSPGVPLEVEEDGKVVFKVKVEAPDYAYSGPLDVDLIAQDLEMVHLELTKTIITTLRKKVELRDSSQIMDLQKGQIFIQNVNVVQALSEGDEVRRVDVEKPFTIVGTEPKVPFKIGEKTGFIIDLYIQAPRENYGGPLEIKVWQ